MAGTNPARASMDTPCSSLLTELEYIWTEIGESEEDKDRMLLELERECMQVYQRKVDEASKSRAQLHQSLLAKEAELAVLMASLGEHGRRPQNENRLTSLKEQLASVTPLVEELRVQKHERVKQFTDVQSQIEKIRAELTEKNLQHDAHPTPIDNEEHDLSIRKLHEYQAQLQALQKEKSDRLHKVLEDVNEVHSLCGVLGLEFRKTVDEVHPSLQETGSGQATNISVSTLKGLSQTIMKLKMEKQSRIQKLREAVESLFELWNLMDTSEEEKRPYEKVTCIARSSEEVSYSGILSLETIQQVNDEVERLTTLKASRMKELVLKKRSELEEICRRAHIEPDMSTAPEKASALIDSGLVDPSEILASIEAQITKANEESVNRKEIMERVNKWLATCEEEKWLEGYNQDENRYNAGRGAHLNLKRAERARVTINKIPAIVDNLLSKTFTWEEERSTPFLYDGVRLVSILEEYKLTRQQKEEEKKRQRDHKKLQGLLLTEREAMYGSKPSPKKSNSFNRKTNGHHMSGNGNGSMTPVPRRVSAGSATPELLTPRSYSGRYNGHFKEMRRLSTAPLNFVAISKEDTLSFASISGSEPGSPPQC